MNKNEHIIKTSQQTGNKDGVVFFVSCISLKPTRVAWFSATNMSQHGIDHVVSSQQPKSKFKVGDGSVTTINSSLTIKGFALAQTSNWTAQNPNCCRKQQHDFRDQRSLRHHQNESPTILDFCPSRSPCLPRRQHRSLIIASNQLAIGEHHHSKHHP